VKTLVYTREASRKATRAISTHPRARATDADGRHSAVSRLMDQQSPEAYPQVSNLCADLEPSSVVAGR
jgi:hypothetical protein